MFGLFGNLSGSQRKMEGSGNSILKNQESISPVADFEKREMSDNQETERHLIDLTKSYAAVPNDLNKGAVIQFLKNHPRFVSAFSDEIRAICDKEEERDRSANVEVHTKRFFQLTGPIIDAVSENKTYTDN